MSAFERLTDRMDALTAKRMGKPISINGTEHVGVDSHFLPEFGPVTGDGLSYVIFSAGYQPRKNDKVVAGGRSYLVTRYQRFNGKWMLFIEAEEDEGD
ncbi:ATP-binding protein [Providencia sp. wls1922]|jgi:hypothetical protein|uniref:ATP-binding protein n=1 Tax=Providencia sp. wls1922 TaxID=2675152 RepID=UPI0012B5A74F|nr:ATP-binding protein [Providencia sp. wls1922]MTC46741.1 ATP-binding protein [Providencia sp. wls1922]